MKTTYSVITLTYNDVVDGEPCRIKETTREDIVTGLDSFLEAERKANEYFEALAEPVAETSLVEKRAECRHLKFWCGKTLRNILVRAIAEINLDDLI